MSNFSYINVDGGKAIKSWDRGVDFADNTYEQAKQTARMPFIHKHVALMPDAHLGKGATVGSVIATKGAIMPASVGVDIGCLDADTEVLTPKGWVKISEWQEGQQILEFDPITEEADFYKPLAYIVRDQDFFYHIKHSKGLDQMVCPRHKILFYNGFHKSKRTYSIEIAESFVEHHKTLSKGRSGGFLSAYGGFVGQSDWSIPHAKVQVMVSADGSARNNNRFEVHVKKERKVIRAREVLKAASVDYEEYQHKDGSFTFSFYWKHPKGLSIFWNASRKTLSAVLEESIHWDGHFNDGKGSWHFYSTQKDDADLIQHAFASQGIRAGIYKTSYQQENWKDCYQVVSTKNKFVNIAPDKTNPVVKVDSVDGKSYCFTTNSGFFVARRNDKIFITGNCGMMSHQTTLKAEDLPDNLSNLRSLIESKIPHGRTADGRKESDRGGFGNISKRNESAWLELLPRYEKIIAKHPKAKAQNTVNHLGTLGTGNHFVEICLDEDDYVWIMLHSGSRGLGNRIGSYFIELAKKDMEKWFINLPEKDLSYFVEGTEHFDDYFEAIEFAQDFAMENRKSMMEAATQAMRKLIKKPFMITERAVNAHHNYATRENHFGENVIVTRKGAVRAREGDLGIIPGSMGTGSFIVRGLGNQDSFCSCSHGAGRVMSRTQAKKIITLDDHIKATEGIECRKDADVIDESPAAYKDIGKVMEAQSDLVEILYRLRQVVNIKG